MIALIPKVLPTMHPTAMTGISTLAAIPVGNSFVMEARFRPLTELKAPFHQASIVFAELEFALEKDAKHPVTVDLVELGKKKLVYMEKPSVSRSRCRVRCTCSAFFFYYSWAVKLQGNQAGQDFPKYTRVSPPSGIPPKNPRNFAGVCKHIAALVVWGQKNKIITG
jgi:hypothetical protein